MARRPTNSYMVCGTMFNIDSNYSLIKPIGQGAYGVVCAAKRNDNGEKVAIKKIGNVFEQVTEAKRTLREIKLLRGLQHENIIALRELLRPENTDSFEDLYLITELLDTDLHQIINSPQPLSEEHCCYFIYQILRGLKFIHSAHVIHRDLKPSNILLNSNCDLKICDFGLARIADPDQNHGAFMTEYVATRWYRAPEVMLSWKQYTAAIDMWAVGCILAELLGRRPLFPGRDYIHQLQLITNFLGTPSEEDIANIGSDRARRYMQSLPFKAPVPLNVQFPAASADALSLLSGLLMFEPSKRLTVTQALDHPYLASLHDPADEPSASAPIDMSFEDIALTKELVKEIIYNETLVYASPEELAELGLDPTVPGSLGSAAALVGHAPIVADVGADIDGELAAMDTS